MNSSNSRGVMKSSDNSTKPSSNIRDPTDEPVPSFMKALHCYTSDVISDDGEENGFLNETFSKSSGNLVDEIVRTRFSDISQKSINKSNVRTIEHNLIDDGESQSALLLESFGDHSNIV